MNFITSRILRAATYIAIPVLILFSLNQDAWSEKKKPTPSSEITAYIGSPDGTLQVLLTTATETKIKKVKAGSVKKIVIKKGTKVNFVAKPKPGFKAGIIVNGELVKFQPGQATANTLEAKKPKVKELKYKLPGLVAFANTKPVIEARFVENNKPFARNAAVVFSGLGSSIKVTNQNPAPLVGIASSDIGVKNVAWQNQTTGAQGTASGTTNWLASVPFASGDNKIRASMTAKDNSVFTNDTVITFYPQIDFTTPLTSSEEILFTGGIQSLNFQIGLSSPLGANVSLIETDSNGVALAAPATPMHDDGILPDEIDSDGLFTSNVSVDTTNTGFKYFRAKVVKPSGTYYSETVTIWITTPSTNAQAQAAIDLANLVKNRFAQLTGSGKTPNQAMAIILAEIKLLPIVGAAGGGDSFNGLWWITEDGILGGFSTQSGQQKGGGNGGQESNREVRRTLAELASEMAGSTANPALVSYYSTKDLYYVSQMSILPSVLAVQNSDPNRVRTSDSIILSPYINNPVNGPDFGSGDDFFGPWQFLIQNGSLCSQKATKSVVNDGSLVVSLDDFKSVGDYGLVHLSTHGDNLYNGLLSLWEDKWGTNNFLYGYLSLVVFDSGLKVPQNTDGTFDITGHEADLAAKRIALFPDGTIFLTPQFFQHYLGHMPNSVVIFSACRSSYNSSMADAFLAKGAGAVFGYTDYVSTGYAKNTTTEIYTKLISEDKTVKEAFDSAVSKFGANDADNDPAALTLFGNNDLKRYGGEISNAGFEDGGLSPWHSMGDGRLIGQLGNFSPVEGSRMGIVSTGLGFTTESGSLTQNFCMPANAQDLKFSWNYSSEEFVEYCNSVYQDTFTVSLCELDPNTEAPLGCQTLFFKNVDSLCGSVSPVGFSFDQGGVYSTGWLNQTIPVPASMVGKTVKLTVSAGDVGDSIYDTAVLVDGFEITKTE